MYLHNLVYVSRSAGLDQKDLDAILAASQRNNLLNRVTGMLLYNADFFMQVLEGPRGEVSDTYRRVANDPRHMDVTIVHAGQIECRQFARWAMHYVPSGRTDRALLLKYSTTDYFDPMVMSQAGLLALAREVAGALEAEAPIRAAPPGRAA